jgi:hypothetical protein
MTLGSNLLVIPFPEVAPNCHNSNKAVDPMVKIGNYITKT